MIRKWLTPAIAIVLALASVASVILLQHRADKYRRAQVTLSNVKAQFTLDAVASLQLVDNLATPAAVHASMSLNQREIGSELAGLLSQSPPPELHGIMKPVRSDFGAVNQIRQVLTLDPSLGDPANILLAVRLGSTASAAGDATDDAIDSATRHYATSASRAEMQSIIGAVFAITALLACFLLFYWRWLRLLFATRRDAHTDALTGLANRRALIDTLSRQLPLDDDGPPLVLTIYDLDGFKSYNDTFGHLAGDALLTRFAGRLAETMIGVGHVYRMGGDEFCCVARVGRDRLEWLLARGRHALQEVGEGFDIGCSAGSVVLPDEATAPDEALRIADQRMYERKAAAHTSASRQSADVLLGVLKEQDSGLRDHIGDVAELATATATELGLSASEVQGVRLAAELHDIGKSAIPEAILSKPGALTEEEWEFIRNHTLIGERIIRAAPSLAQVATAVRASHERVDSTGYPDGIGGDDIPIASRIVAVCDAFDAMVSQRPYRARSTIDEALAELRRCRGTQFDARIVDVTCAIVETRLATEVAA